MDQETKEILSNPKTLYSIAIVLSLFLGVACVDIYSALNHEEQQNISNFKINLSDILEGERNSKHSGIELNQIIIGANLDE